MTDLATWQRRDARRREQYRRYQRTKRWGAPLGWLHSLSCSESRGNHRARKRCAPIPIYDPRLVDDG